MYIIWFLHLQNEDLYLKAQLHERFILMVILCLCLLTSYAVSKIYIQPNASKSQARWQKLIQPSITPSKNLGHIEVDPEQASDSWVNLRNNPSTEAAVIGKATVGKKYSILVIRSNWIKIQMDASSSAWISKKIYKKIHNEKDNTNL